MRVEIRRIQVEGDRQVHTFIVPAKTPLTGEEAQLLRENFDHLSLAGLLLTDGQPTRRYRWF